MLRVNPFTGELELVTASGGGGGGVTSISAGNGITLTPNPITTTGTVAVTKQPLLNATLFNDVLAGAVVRGDLIVGNITPNWARLAIGAAAKYLRSDGIDASWQTIAYADISGTPTSLPPSGAAGGDLTGTYPNPTIAKINGIAIGADPFAQYLKLAGRTGATNNPTISTDTNGGIVGCAASGFGLNLTANPIDAQAGSISLTPTGVALTAGSIGAIDFFCGSSPALLRLNDGAGNFIGVTVGTPLGVDATYTLPLTVPAGTGRFLTSTVGGAMSWAQVDFSNLTGTATKGQLPLPLDHHADLTNFTANDDHTQYIFGAGRAGGQTWTGGTTGADNATILPNPAFAAANAGRIIFDERVIHMPTSRGTFTNSFNVINIGPGAVYTIGATNPILVNFSGEIKHVVAPPLGLSPAIFAGNGAVRMAATATTIAPQITTTSMNNIADGVVWTLTSALGFGCFADGSGFTTVNGGSIVGSYNSFGSNISIGAGVALTLRQGYVAYDAIGGGTVATQVAYDVGTWAKGATNITFRSTSASASMRHTGPARFGDQTAPTDQVEVAALAGTGIRPVGAKASGGLTIISTTGIPGAGVSTTLTVDPEQVEESFTIVDVDITATSLILAHVFNELDYVAVDVHPRAGSLDVVLKAIDPETNGPLKGIYNFEYLIA